MNKTLSRMVFAAVAAAAMCGCTAYSQGEQAADTSGRDCFNVRSISGYSTVDDDTLRLNIGPSRSYEVDYSGALCSEVNWTNRIAIEARPSPWICVGRGFGQAEILFRDPSRQGVSQCYIDEVRAVVEEPAAEEPS